MAYKQYTSCVQPGNFVDLGFNPVGVAQTILLLITYGVVAFVVIAITGGPAVIIAAIALVTAVITYLNWWLFGRLICLGDDARNCAIIGMVRSHGPSDPLEKAGDNDYTMNIFLAPGPLDLDDPKGDFWAPPQGHLVAENPAIHSIGRGYVQEGKNLKYLKSLHCEFEGDGIRKLLDAAYGALAALLLALVVPGFWIVAVIIALLAIISQIFGEPGAPGSGNPLDVDSSLGTLDRGHVVVLRGVWIYDSLHDGWNEIHAVHACQIVGRLQEDMGWASFSFTDAASGTDFDLNSADSVDRYRALWCDALDEADDAEEGGSRDNPVHDWGIHPQVDGCRESVVIL